MKKQVKSAERKKDHGEVFTNEREINGMYDLILSASGGELSLETTFLEPACGDGNFLVNILKRKLKLIKKRGSEEMLLKKIFLAVSSLYGVDILSDNVEECRTNLLLEVARKVKGTSDIVEFLSVIRFILEKNIVHGDFLEMKESNGSDLKFTEWKFVSTLLIVAKEYELQTLNKHTSIDEKINDKMVIPKYIKETAVTHFMEVDNEWYK